MRMRMLVCLCGLLAAASCSRPRETVVFDFRTGFTVANANWPPGASDYYERWGEYHFIIRSTVGTTLDIPDGWCYSGRRDGAKLRHVIINFGTHYTLGRAYSEGRRVLEAFHESREELDRLDRWRDYVTAHPPTSTGQSGFGREQDLKISAYQDSPDGQGNCSIMILIKR